MAEETNEEADKKEPAKKPGKVHVLASMGKPTPKEEVKNPKPEDEKEPRPGKGGEKDGSKKRKEATKIEDKVLHSVTFDLTEDEFAGKGKHAAGLQGKINGLESKFKIVKDEHKAETSLLESECSQVLAVIRRGKEDREVECTRVLDFENAIAEFWYKGKLVDSRPMRPDEKQMKAPF